MSPKRDLVSVIIPAYNARGTIGATLRSVRTQSHRWLEILVVDDGSTDDTIAIVEEHARIDRRVRLLRQTNRGVGAARNAGLKAASGKFVAPVDADDLWSPEKIERQLDAHYRAGGNAGVVYTWAALINAYDEVESLRSRPRAEGAVLARMCEGNLLGNASSALMPRDIVMAAGGYDETLHARGLQGCEDLKLYWWIAQNHPFVCVPEFLTGYRMTRGNMSSAVSRMVLSFEAVLAEFRQLRPEFSRHYHVGRIENFRWAIIRLLRGSQWGQLPNVIGAYFRHDPRSLAIFAARLPVHFTRLFFEGVGLRLRARLSRADRRFLCAEPSAPEEASGIGARPRRTRAIAKAPNP